MINLLCMDSILSIILNTPQEIMLNLAERAKSVRLNYDLTQMGLAKRSGVSFGSIKRFEKSGHISLESLLKIAAALGKLDDFEKVLLDKQTIFSSIDELMQEKKQRKRGKIK